MITPKIKDAVLQSFISLGMRCQTNIRKDCFDFDLAHDEYDAIITQFEELNLLKTDRRLGGEVRISINVNACDLLNRGGFYAQDELLKANIEKLDLELQSLIKQLDPSLAEKAQNILSLGANILSATSFLWDGK